MEKRQVNLARLKKQVAKSVSTNLKPFKGKSIHSDAIEEFEKEKRPTQQGPGIEVKNNVPKNEERSPEIPRTEGKREERIFEKIANLVNSFISTYVLKPIASFSIIISSTIFPIKTALADDFAVSSKTGSASGMVVSSFNPQGQDINTIVLDSNTVKQAFEVGADTSKVDFSRFLVEQVKAHKTELMDLINEGITYSRFKIDDKGKIESASQEQKYSVFSLNGDIPIKFKITENIEIILDFDGGIRLFSDGKRVDGSPGNSTRFYRDQGIRISETGLANLETEKDKIKFYEAFVKLVQDNVRIFKYKFTDHDNNEKEFIMLGFKQDGASTNYIFWMFVPGQEEVVELLLPYGYLAKWSRSPPGFAMDVGFTFDKYTDENKIEIIEFGIIFAAKDKFGKRMDSGYAKVFSFMRGFNGAANTDLNYSAYKD